MQDIKRVNIILLITILLEETVTTLGVTGLLPGVPLKLLFSQLILCGPMLAFPFIFKRGFFGTVGLKKTRISNILISIIFYFLISKVLTLINAISMLVFPNSIGSVIYSMSESTPYPVALLTVAILPAFCEECMNRGIIYNTYRQVSPLRAMLMSALIFGLMHGNLNQFSYAFFMGFVFILLNEATGTLASSMTVHLLANAVSTTLVYLLPRLLQLVSGLAGSLSEAGQSALADSPEANYSTGNLSELFSSTNSSSVAEQLPAVALEGLVGGVAAFLVFRWLAKRNGRWEHVKGIFSKKYRATAVQQQISEGSLEAAVDIDNAKIITIPLAIALAILMYDIVVNGLLTLGVISLK